MTQLWSVTPQLTLFWRLVIPEHTDGHLEGPTSSQEATIIYWITWSTWNVYYVTGFAKTRHNSAWTEIHFIAWHESHTLGLSRHTDDRAKDNQVCFHRQHFSDPVNSWRSTAGYMVPLGHTNKAACGVKLLPTTVLAWDVHCGCFCALLKTQ